MPRLVPLLVALLAVAAGCTGGPVAPGATDTTPAETASPTATDAPTATDEPSSTPGIDPSDLNGSLAPGVSADGIENASVLLDAHSERLSSGGFELVVDQRFSQDGETYEFDRRVTAAPDVDRVRGNATNNVTGDVVVQRTWLDETTTRQLSMIDAVDETRYRIPPVGPAGSDARARYARQLVQERQLADLVEGGEFEVTAVNETDGDRLYTLVATNVTAGDTFDEREVHMYVTEDGVIQTLKAKGSLSDGGSFSYGYHLARLGVESVEEPDWVEGAPEPIDTRPTAGFENCTVPYLTLENEDPDAVPAGTVVTVTLNDTDYEATLDAPLETGERRALYLDADGKLRIADVDSVPANRTPMPNEAGIRIVTGDGLLLTNGSMGFGCESVSAGDSGSGSGGGSSQSGSASEGSAGE